MMKMRQHRRLDRGSGGEGMYRRIGFLRDLPAACIQGAYGEDVTI